MKTSQINTLLSSWVQNIQRYLYLSAGKTSLRLRISGFCLRSRRNAIYFQQIFESRSFSPLCAIVWLLSSRNSWVLARWGRKLFSCWQSPTSVNEKECGLWIILYFLLQMSALLSLMEPTLAREAPGWVLVRYGQLDLICLSIAPSDILLRTWWARCSLTWLVYCLLRRYRVQVDEVDYDRTTLLSYWISNVLWSQFSCLPCPPTLSSLYSVLHQKQLGQD